MTFFCQWPPESTNGASWNFCWYISLYRCFQKYGKTPQIIHFNRVFHYPFWVPLFLETSILRGKTLVYVKNIRYSTWNGGVPPLMSLFDAVLCVFPLKKVRWEGKKIQHPGRFGCINKQKSTRTQVVLANYWFNLWAQHLGNWAVFLGAFIKLFGWPWFAKVSLVR